MDSFTIFIALAVLLLHALLLLVSLVALTSKKNSLTAHDSLRKTLVLALEFTRSPRLFHSSAGVEDSRVWRERVTLCEFSGTRQLFLVVGDPAKYSNAFGPPPQKGRKYV